MCYRLLLVFLLAALACAPAQAGFPFGRKKEKPDPKQRVPELIAILEADRDADKRTKAADELREHDPATFPALVPALIKALQSDPKVSVRIEAAHTLSKLRPVSSQVGDALEQAVAKDDSMRVRLQARSALLHYHWAGYRGKKSDAPPPLYTNREPPLAAEKGPLPPTIDTQKPIPVPAPTAKVPTNPNRPAAVPPPPSKMSRIRITPLYKQDQPKPNTTIPVPATLPKAPMTNEPPLAAPVPTPAPPILAPMPPPTPAPKSSAPAAETGPILE